MIDNTDVLRQHEGGHGLTMTHDTLPTSERTKRVMLANMRHDLHTPINAIIGYSEMLIEEATDLKLLDFIPDLQKMLKSGHHLLTLIDTFLDSSKQVGENIAFSNDSAAIQLRHDLRTPLCDIMGYSELLSDEAQHRPHPSIIADLTRIHDAGSLTISLIDDILNLSKIEAGTLALDTDRVNGSKMIHDVVTTIRPLAEDAASRPNSARGTILVVDDNETNRDMFSRRLERHGHAVTVAEHGRQALELLASHQFDLVLLDLMMPDMNGFQVLQHLKADETLRHIPVIMVSALEEIDSVVRCIEMGAEDYLPKPCNPILLRARIDACLEKKWLRDREVMHLRDIETEKKRSDELLHVILPHTAVEELKANNTVQPRRHDNVAILFCDVAGFTHYCNQHPPEEVFSHLQTMVEYFEGLTLEHGLEKIKTIGDAFMATAGLLAPAENPTLNSVRCGLDMIAGLEHIKSPWKIRVGIHIGPVMAGVVGRRTFVFDVWGDTVNTAERIENNGTPGRVTVSAAAWEHVSAHCNGISLGSVPMKGIGDLEIFRIDGLRCEAQYDS